MWFGPLNFHPDPLNWDLLEGQLAEIIWRSVLKGKISEKRWTTFTKELYKLGKKMYLEKEEKIYIILKMDASS